MSTKLSLCLCTYNGQNFLHEQIASIEGQKLSSLDEIIIVDDCSSDCTLDILYEWSKRDSRVHIIVNKKNLGVIQSFAIALHSASGDIILLSDQDDIWHPLRVHTTFIALKPICSQPYVYIHNASVINSSSLQIVPSFSQIRGSFSSSLMSNLFKNRYIGCCMAVTRPLLMLSLPFPPLLPMHDIWLGILGSSLNNVIYSDSKLLAYRRHDSNVTGLVSSNSIFHKLYLRLLYIISIIEAYRRIILVYGWSRLLLLSIKSKSIS